MEKRKITTAPSEDPSTPEWLPLEDLARVEITSEAAAHPIEAALVPGGEGGWVAEGPGEQTIRLNFKSPVAVRQVRIVVEERERARTQEFLLRVASPPEGPWRELVRQQFTFSPSGATRQQEDYHVNLPSIAALELTIVPDVSGGDARASLQQLRIA